MANNTQKVRIKKSIRRHAIHELKLNGITHIDNKSLSSVSNKILFSKYNDITGSYPRNVILKQNNVNKHIEKIKCKAEMEERQKDGFVYFIGNIDYMFVKIGYSKTPEKRIKEIQTGCPFYLEIFYIESGTMTKERKYHNEFRNQRTYGEWFKIKDILSDFLNTKELFLNSKTSR